ncbi:MAG: NAD(P)-dependent oxidoreductase [Phycisphaerae bacterium]|nr:NAD(P)-dependent oxidoreductase [Phycisphaerae bacterium]
MSLYNKRHMNIGFIGLGIMGAPMAGHLVSAGHKLFVHTRTRGKADALLARGAVWRDSPAAVAAECEVLCLNVPDTPDVERVLFDGADAASAAVNGLRPGSIVIDFSTISPSAARDFAARLARQQVTLLDAPVTGGERGAIAATLTIMVGGEKAAFERVRPVLGTLGKTVVHVGPSGAGQTLKAVNQILVAVNMIGVSEAIAFARRGGVELPLALETLGGGAGGSWAWSNLGAKIAADDLKPAFMIKLMQKDLRIVQDAAQALGVALPGTALAQQLFRAIEAQPGGSELGTQAMSLAIERLCKPLAR